MEKTSATTGHPQAEGSASPDSIRPGGNCLTVPYLTERKLLIVFAALFLLLVAYACINSGVFIIHLFGVAAVAASVPGILSLLNTRSIVLEPERITKRRRILGDITIPSAWAVVSSDQQRIVFFHGSSANRRERVTIPRWMIKPDDGTRILEYASDIYGISLRGKSGVSGSVEGEGRKVDDLTVRQFTKALSSYRTARLYFFISFLIVFFTAALTDTFDGLFPELPLHLVRGAAFLLVIASYFLLRKLNPDRKAAASDRARPSDAFHDFSRMESAVFASSIVAAGAGFVGMCLFLLSGNLLDYYLIFGIGLFWYFDFYPRLSAWELVSGAMRKTDAEPATVPSAPRRRSLQVSLVLMGALAVATYGDSRQYLYKNKKDCMDDWGSDQACREAPYGSSYYRTGYYFGPRYGSRSGSGMTHAVGSATVSRGGFGSMAGFHASTGG